jgi:hypothetical protein
LAYLILHGILKDEEYLRQARQTAAFYNAFFLDHDDGGIYFNTLANGIPYLLGNERLKGSHSMSGYHSMELCYLASVYTNLLIKKQPMHFYFKPLPNSLKGNILRVSPDIFPPESIYIDECSINGQPFKHYEKTKLTIQLPESRERLNVKVRIAPRSWLD